MLTRNGVSLEIGCYRKGMKRPALYMYDSEHNDVQKVATFDSFEMAETFREAVVERFLKGLVEREDEDE